MQIFRGMITSILKAEDSVLRFERFSIKFVEKIEGGLRFVGTSRSWDLARDGRSISADGFICCSTTDEVDDKIQEDIERLIKFVTPQKIYFCSTQFLSEKRCHELEIELRKTVNCTIQVMGRDHIAELVEPHPELIQEFYPAELEECKRILSADTFYSPDHAEQALNFAARISNISSSVQAREESYEACLLTILTRKSPMTFREISRDLFQLLKLSSGVPDDILAQHIDRLEKEGLIERNQDQYYLSASGKERHEQSELPPLIRTVYAAHLASYSAGQQ